LLTIWPASLYQILGNDAVGAAIGLVAAGAVLIATVIVLSASSHLACRIALIFSIANYYPRLSGCYQG
jgi:hypothetical protein